MIALFTLFLKFQDCWCSSCPFRLLRCISALRVPPAETQVDGLPPASSLKYLSSVKVNLSNFEIFGKSTETNHTMAKVGHTRPVRFVTRTTFECSIPKKPKLPEGV